jgi:hypothetical protein
VSTIIAICAGLVALSAISIQAAPLPPSKAVPTELSISPPIELAAEGCGYGQRRTHWQDRACAVYDISPPDGWIPKQVRTIYK